MLAFNLSRVMALRGIEKPFAFLVKRGFYRTIASCLINNRVANLKISHLETLCRTLNCTPNDLFEWRASEGDALSPNHALNSLIREKNTARIAQIVKDIPVDQMHRVEEMLNELKSEIVSRSAENQPEN